MKKQTKETSFWKPEKISSTKVIRGSPLFDFPGSKQLKGKIFTTGFIPKTKYISPIYVQPKRVSIPSHMGINPKQVHPINMNTNIPKKNMNWFQAKTKFPKLNPFGDADHDGVINMLDCKPFNKKKDMAPSNPNVTRHKFGLPKDVSIKEELRFQKSLENITKIPNNFLDRQENNNYKKPHNQKSYQYKDNDNLSYIQHLKSVNKKIEEEEKIKLQKIKLEAQKEMKREKMQAELEKMKAKKELKKEKMQAEENISKQRVEEERERRKREEEKSKGIKESKKVKILKAQEKTKQQQLYNQLQLSKTEARNERERREFAERMKKKDEALIKMISNIKTKPTTTSRKKINKWITSDEELIEAQNLNKEFDEFETKMYKKAELKEEKRKDEKVKDIFEKERENTKEEVVNEKGEKRDVQEIIDEVDKTLKDVNNLDAQDLLDEVE